MTLKATPLPLSFFIVGILKKMARRLDFSAQQYAVVIESKNHLDQWIKFIQSNQLENETRVITPRSNFFISHVGMG